MKRKSLLLLLLAVYFLSPAQVKFTGDSVVINEEGKYHFKKHPFDDNKIICKYYNRSNILKQHCEYLIPDKSFINNSSELISLMHEKKLVNDGNYYEFFDSGDTSLIAKYDHGYKIETELRLFENGIIKEQWEYISPVKAHFTGYYPDGTRLIDFTVVNNKKEGLETHYFESGKTSLKIAYKGSGIKLTEYGKSGEILKEEEYQNNILLPNPCSIDSNSNSANIIKPLSLQGDLNEEIGKLYKNETILAYLKGNTLRFSFTIKNNGVADNLSFEDSPEMINFILYRWFSELPQWKQEMFLNMPVNSKVTFNLSEIDGPFVMEKMEYNMEWNNHAYNPVYLVKPCVYNAIEEMPVFQGGDIKLAKYLTNHLRYPASAAKSGKEGIVYVQFVITREGNVKNVKILRGIDPALDTEAMRVISSMPAWNPGKHKGIVMPVQMTLPINFKMEK